MIGSEGGGQKGEGQAAPEHPVSVERIDECIVLVEYRQPPNNYLDDSSLGALADALEFAGQNQACRCIVLASEGKHFSAGGHFEPDGDPGDAARDRLYAAALRTFRIPVPIVAAIQGAAVGGGLGLALAADFRVSTPETRFVANFARLGYHPGFGLTVTLPRLLGHQRALELLLTGRAVQGEEALGLGICDRLSSQEGLRAAAVQLARELSGSAPLSLRSIKAALRRNLAEEVAAALEREKEQQAIAKRTRDFQEGVRAAIDRRQPSFTGC